MIPVRATQLIAAPEGAVRRVLGRTDVWTRTARALGARAEVAGPRTGPAESLRSGDLIRVAMDSANSAGSLLPRRSLILRVAIDPIRLPSLELVAGPLKDCRINVTTAATGAGTLVTVDVRVRASPALLTPLLRRRVLRAARLLLGVATLAAREILVVVAGAVIEDGRVLAARRTGPPELAGRWELPGGKVIAGETEKAALARELEEELGVAVTVGSRVGGDVDLGDNVVLRCYLAVIVAGRPQPSEHDAVKWLGAGELAAVDWLDPDRRLLADLERAALDDSG